MSFPFRFRYYKPSVTILAADANTSRRLSALWLRLGEVSDQNQRRTIFWPDHRDIVGGAIATAAGFIPTTQKQAVQPECSLHRWYCLSSMSPAAPVGCRPMLLPSVRFRRVCAIARGEVVSRGSPGMAVFNVGSVRSRRNVSSPSCRANAVTLAGRQREQSAYSSPRYRCTVARPRLLPASDIVPLTCFSAIGL